MVMVLSNKLLFDTNILFSLCERKFDIFAFDLILGKTKYFITRSSLKEIDRLKEKDLKKAKCYNILKKILEKFEVIEDKEEYADSSFIKLSNDYIFITNDRDLVKRLKSQNKIVYILNKKGLFMKA